MDLFKDFFKIGVDKRHRKPIIGGTDFQKKHLNMVPAKYKKDNSKCEKIEILKTRPGRFFCEPKDVEYITTNFLKGVPAKPGELKTLGGKMNMKFYQDPKSGKWIIEKQ